MGHLEGNFTPVLYMGRKVPKISYVTVSVGRMKCRQANDA